MNNLSAKNKIYLVIAVWFIGCALFFGYFFNILDNSNAGYVTKIADLKKQLQILKAEQQSYRQAQSDLDAVKALAYQPEDFFSKDLTLVNEIKTLEALGNKTNVKYELSGLSGTINTVQKANTNGPIYIIPITFSVSGAFQDVLGFIESLENLPFIINVSTLSVSAASQGGVAASMTSSLYISK